MLYVCVNCDFGCCEVGNGNGFQFQRSGIEVDEGAVHGQPTSIKNSPDLRVGPKMSI